MNNNLQLKAQLVISNPYTDTPNPYTHNEWDNMLSIHDKLEIDCVLAVNSKKCISLVLHNALLFQIIRYKLGIKKQIAKIDFIFYQRNQARVEPPLLKLRTIFHRSRPHSLTLWCRSRHLRDMTKELNSLQNALDSINDWCKMWGLSIAHNHDKCRLYMSMGRRILQTPIL